MMIFKPKAIDCFTMSKNMSDKEPLELKKLIQTDNLYQEEKVKKCDKDHILILLITV